MPEKKQITEGEIREIANKFLVFLNREEITNIENLEEKIGNIPVVGMVGHSITIEIRPSDLGTGAYTLSYIVPEKGIPIEARLNPELNYTRLIVKTCLNLIRDGYSLVFDDYDRFGNLLQDKKLKECSISRLKGELKFLARPEHFT